MPQLIYSRLSPRSPVSPSRAGDRSVQSPILRPQVSPPDRDRSPWRKREHAAVEANRKSWELQRLRLAEAARRRLQGELTEEERTVAEQWAKQTREHRAAQLSEPASLTHSLAVGEGLRGHALQTPTAFWIHAADMHGRARLSGGDAFSVSIRGPSRVTPTLIDNDDGTYEVRWMASVSGSYLISTLLNGEHLKGSPFMARVITPEPDPQQCRATAPAGGIAGSVSYPAADANPTIHAVAGGPACFDIAFHDALGRPVAMEQTSLRLSVTPWRSLQDALSMSRAYAIRVPDADGRGRVPPPSPPRSATQIFNEHRASVGLPAAAGVETGMQADAGTAGAEAHTVRPAAGDQDDADAATRLTHLSLRAEPTPPSYPHHLRVVSVGLERAGDYQLHVVREPVCDDARPVKLRSPLAPPHPPPPLAPVSTIRSGDAAQRGAPHTRLATARPSRPRGAECRHLAVPRAGLRLPHARRPATRLHRRHVRRLRERLRRGRRSHRADRDGGGARRAAVHRLRPTERQVPAALDLRRRGRPFGPAHHQWRPALPRRPACGRAPRWRACGGAWSDNRRGGAAALAQSGAQRALPAQEPAVRRGPLARHRWRNGHHPRPR